MEKKVHFYSQSRMFPNLNLKYQGIEFYAFKEEISGSIPVYRFVHDETMTNFYTVNSVAERRYKKEEISFYAFDKKIDLLLNSDSELSISKSISIGIDKFATTFVIQNLAL